ncbi:MAG: hypothetical protein AABX82_06685 [Nanoarchaeota archaeon]
MENEQKENRSITRIKDNWVPLGAGAAAVKYDLPAKMHDTYFTLEHKVDAVYNVLRK